ncbi:hypothetical protein K2X30_13120 [bacterium]|nr:hypothetical protein [bacterium]
MRKCKAPTGEIIAEPAQIEILSPDTLNSDDLIRSKELLKDRLESLRCGDAYSILFKLDPIGASCQEVRVRGNFDLFKKADLGSIYNELFPGPSMVYSLFRLPTTTDPLWMFSVLTKLKGYFSCLVTFRGLDPDLVKRRVEGARKHNSAGPERVTNIDAEVSFGEATEVLRGISRGDESLIEASVLIVSDSPIKLDENLFCREKDPTLALVSALGIRKRLHRSHWIRLTTATDLIPNILDPQENPPAILKTLRGNPLYFSPQDSRLEALHWLVVGASGSGKSFFAGLVLKRMLEAGTPMSVLFVDHNRSFRRIVRSRNAPYIEPESLQECREQIERVFESLDSAGNMAGIELSDLNLAEKQLASRDLLGRFEAFLRKRTTTFPIYLVLDECWNFLRDEPVLVQRAFREFRKLNGAAVAITQSLADFLTDQSGQSIFQNAPIRILLRQGEDVSRYQGILGLNDIELSRVKSLAQRRGQYSECLIKTPFLSRIGRLYPTFEEHELLRTDNLRLELTQEILKGKNIKC